MVGIDVFSEHFKGFYESYIVIGGVACEDHLREEGLDFRVTKDIDLVLVIEALNNDFIARFWEFIELGEYSLKQVGETERKYYRFINPQNERFPMQIELFSRKPDIILETEGMELTPIPTDEELSSLSSTFLLLNFRLNLASFIFLPSSARSFSCICSQHGLFISNSVLSGCFLQQIISVSFIFLTQD